MYITVDGSSSIRHAMADSGTDLQARRARIGYVLKVLTHSIILAFDVMKRTDQDLIAGIIISPSPQKALRHSPDALCECIYNIDVIVCRGYGT